MGLKETINKIEELQQQIDSSGKLDRETLNRINYKFRLDWNYHSNAMEGNSLTRQETRSVMVNNITIEGKPLKDVLEVKGHDAVITDMLKIGKGEIRLSEKRIKDIHKAIIHEDNPEEKTKIGQWKTVNNHLINYKGEKFDFVSYQDVPEKMHELMDWLNSEFDRIKLKKKGALHPVILAFEFHYRYVTIHPFYDGNGRTGRILANLILITFGYPPVIIKIDEKNKYGQYLSDIQAYGGDPDLFYEFMAQKLIYSQELVLRAIQGEEVEEADDLDKKILLLEKELSAIDSDNELKERFNGEVLHKMYSTWMKDLVEKAIPVVQKFNKFFTGTQHRVHVNLVGGVTFANEPADEILEKLEATIEKNKQQIDGHDNRNLTFRTHYGALIKGGLNTFGCNYGFKIDFDDIKYKVSVDEFSEKGERKEFQFKERLLHQSLSEGEMEKLIGILGETIYQHIDFNTKKSGIR